MKNRKGLLVVALLILAGSGTWLYLYLSSYVYTNDAQIDGYYYTVSPDISARVITLDVDEGAVVNKGEVLAVLDSSLPLAERVTAIANVAATEANIKLKEIILKRIYDDYERGVKGIHDEIITKEQFDHLQKGYEAAKADLELEKKNNELAKAKVDQIDAYLLHTKIYAARNGIIAKRWGLAGDVLQAGQALLSLYDLDNLWVTVNLQETAIKHVHLGSKAEIHVDAYPGVKFEGEVFVIRGAAASQFSLLPQDNATGNYTKVAQRVPLKISIHPPKEDKDQHFYLFPGMSAEVKIWVK